MAGILAKIKEEHSMKKSHSNVDIHEGKETVSVTVVEGKELASKDSNGLSDPFFEVSIPGFSRAKHKSKVIKETLNPKWNETFLFKLDNTQAGKVNITVWDWDRIGTNDFMGEIEIPLCEAMVLDGKLDNWYDLKTSSKHAHDEVKGQIHVKITCMITGDATTANMSAEELRNFATTSTNQHLTRSAPDNYSTTAPAPPAPVMNQDPGGAPPPPLPARPSHAQKLVALYDFTAENPGEVSCSAGDELEVIDQPDDVWYNVKRIADGSTGFIPSNYVQRK